MTETKYQILERMRESMPFHLPERIRPYIEDAMQTYADQQLQLHIVSQQRELLIGYLIGKNTSKTARILAENEADRYLKTINCG